MCRRKWVFPAIRHAKTSLVLSDNESPSLSRQSFAGMSQSQPSAKQLPVQPSIPSPILTTDAAVVQWPHKPGFIAFWGWVKRRCVRLKGRDILEGPYDHCPSVRRMSSCSS